MIRNLPIVGENTPTECGNRMKEEKRLRFDEEGHGYLEVYDLTDLQEYINSHEPSVNVNNIVHRYMMGDDSALERAEAFYADVSDMPVKLQDLFNINQKAKDVFGTMPKEIRDLYNNNYIEFVNDPERLSQLVKPDKKPDEKPVDKSVEKVEEVKNDD